jgi:hypothetical protein
MLLMTLAREDEQISDAINRQQILAVDDAITIKQ